MLLLRWSLSSLSQVERWHAPAGRRTCEPRPLAQDGQIRPAPPVGAVNLGPGRRIVLQDSPHGVSRLGSQAGTQAPDPTPVSAQNRGSRAGSTTHSLPADSARLMIMSATRALRHRKSSYALPLVEAGVQHDLVHAVIRAGQQVPVSFGEVIIHAPAVGAYP